MKILIAIGEMAYIHKVGGMGDVGFELPDALAKSGIDVEVILPRYNHINLAWKHSYSGDVLFGDTRLPFRVLSGVHPINNQIKVHLIDEQAYVSSNQYDDAKRNGVFCLAIASWIKNTKNNWDVVHVHDWHSALLPLMLKKDEINIPTILTIHNLLYQGICPANLANDLHLPTSWTDLSWDLGNGDMNFMLEGIMYADQITAVSPTYAREIQEVELGGGLNEVLRKNSGKLTGVLNGISKENWNPETDTVLDVMFGKNNWRIGKESAKKQLSKELEIPEGKILLGYVGRADRRQKGLPLIMELVENHWQDEWRLVILSTGEPDLEAELRQMEAKWPDKVDVITRYDEKLARIIYAASDFMLIPSRYEPCGLVQLIAMRYGTIPVVRRTGGLADTIFDNVNGFSFEKYDVSDFSTTLNRGIKIWTDNKERLVITAMNFDSSWESSAKKYCGLYEKLGYKSKS